MANEPKINGSDVRMFKGKREMFTKRFCVSDPKSAIAQISQLLATIVAEDANTAFYVQEYGFRGNEGAREDYIHYMANRLEFEIRKVGVK